MPPSTPLRLIRRRGARNHRQGSAAEAERYENLHPNEKTSPKLAAMKNAAAAGWLITLAVTVFARPEPPVNQYLPPNQQFPQSQRGSDLSPSTGPGAQYLPPNSNGHSREGYQGDGSNDGPARYEFEYTVNDPDSGSDFGHKESREGSVARGVYYVLLPDGRRQTVEYEADQDGFRPRVTYTDEGATGGNPGGSAGYAY